MNNRIDADFNNLVKYNHNIGYNNITDKEFTGLVEWASKTDPKVNMTIKETDYYYYGIIALIIIIVVILLLVFYYNIKPSTPTIDDMINDKNKSSYIDAVEYNNEIIDES